MLYRTLLCILLSIDISKLVYAQTSGIRYIDDVFATVDTAGTSGVIFGKNLSKNYFTGATKPVTLRLDFYQPAGDTATRRPLVILAFGGAFVQGQRQDLDNLCRAFARKGYATATIDYRLLQSDPLNYLMVYANQGLLADEIIRASSDLKAAIRFFKHDAATLKSYRIDPNKIFVGGFSAGAITALQTAYTDNVTENPAVTAAYASNGGLEGNTDLPAPGNLLPAYSATGIAGVVSLAGGVASLGIISVGNPPLYSAQGTADQVVSYDSGYVQPTAYKLYGSRPVHMRATAVGIRNQIRAIVGGNHSSPMSDTERPQIVYEAAVFLQALISPATPLPMTLVSFTGQPGANCTATLSWRTAAEHNSQLYEVQASVDGLAYSLLGAVPSRNQLAGAAYQYQVASLAGNRYFRLRLVDLDGTFTFSPVVVLAGTCSPAGVQAYPNPATSQLAVSGVPAGGEVRLYNGTGQLVRQATADEGGAVLSLQALPAGVYLVRAVEAGGQAKTVRVLKQ